MSRITTTIILTIAALAAIGAGVFAVAMMGDGGHMPTMATTRTGTDDTHSMETLWAAAGNDPAEVVTTGRGGPATSAIRVCVLDTGARTTHNDLASNVVATWPDDARDDNGHGTHVAGTVLSAARAVSTATTVDLMVAKVLDADMEGDWATVVAALDWCTDNDARIISMSLAAPEGTAAVEAAIARATAADILLVAAAGNDATCTDCVGYPAADPATLAVSSITTGNVRATKSSHGSQIDVVAIGEGVTGPSHTSDDDYVVMSGTSMATPRVAGMAAAIAAHNPTWTADTLRDHLTAAAAANDLGTPGHDDLFGHGALHATSALLDDTTTPVTNAIASIL